MKSKRFKIPAVCWILLALYIILMMSHTYGDLLVTTRQGINFWHILKEGKFLDFYAENICASGNTYYTGVFTCVYNILVYAVFAVWNLPLAVLQTVFHVDIMNNFGCLLYMRLLPVLFLGLSIMMGMKIVRFFCKDAQKELLFCILCGSSLLVVAPVFIISQYDTFELFFILWGILAWLEKKHLKFLMLFSIAFCMKFFALFVFVPLLLLRQKRPLLIIRDFLAFLLCYIATTLPFALWGNGVDQASDLIRSFIAQSNLYGTNLLALLMIVICCVAVLARPSDEIQEGKLALWLSACAMGTFFAVTYDTYPYWIVLLAPLLTLLAVIGDKKQLFGGILLETVACLAYTIRAMIRMYNCYWGATMDSMLWGKFFPKMLAEGMTNNAVRDTFVLMASDQILPNILHAIFAGALLCMLCYFWPFATHKRDSLGPELQSDQWVKEILCIRVGSCVLLALLPVISLWI